MSPEKLGRYQIVREIGHGAMGVVYEALDPTIDRRIALKAIRFDGIGTTADEAARRFKNEARAAGGLNHPNIVTVYDAGEDNGILYLAMEFIEGSALDVVLRSQRTFSPERTLELIRQVCAGLDFAHAKGIVHRDIKPANVMLASNGLVKITDFGIARAGEAMTVTGQVVGTPNYMSPEQVLGKPLDGRSDLFSVGVMLYEMLTGERPFEGQSITTIMYKIVHETPIPPRKLDASIHPGLSAVIEKSLAKAPEERFQSGKQLTEALENYQRASVQTGVLDTPTTEMPRFSSPGVSSPATPPPQPQVTPGSAAQAPAVRMRAAVGRLFADRTRRRRIVAVMFIGLAWVWSQYGHRSAKHDQTEHSQPETIASRPAAPPTPPGTDSTSDEQATTPVSNDEPVVVKRESASSSAQTALLKVGSNPPAAEVYVDGKDTGKTTPNELQLARGQHSVSVRMAGFQPASATFRVKGGEEIEYAPQLSVVMPNINIPNVAMPDLSKLQDLSKAAQGQYWQKWLQTQTGNEPRLVLNSQPPGAQVFIDGKDSGKRTPAIIPVDPGTYKVRFELDGFEPAEREMTVSRHKPASANPVLKPSNPQP
jgi:serine/threonine-protein kinase